jgi:membrane protease YdiL (CAAX protease family)
VTLRPPLREPLLTFLGATALAAGFFWLGRAVPMVGSYVHLFIAITFLYAPAAAARLGGQPFDYRDAGLRFDPLGRGAATLAIAVAICFPLFLAAFFLFYGYTCGPSGAWVMELIGRLPCATWGGGAGWHLRLPPSFPTLILHQVVVIALPEELFFRGYLQARLEARWPPRRRVLGASVGWALVAASLLFALGHFLVDFNGQRLSVFFPALVFGWMRARSGSLAPGIAFHALCNLFADILHTSAF